MNNPKCQNCTKTIGSVSCLCHNCNQLLKSRHDKLLEFVKEIANLHLKTEYNLWSELNIGNAVKNTEEARELLKEIDEI